MKPAPFEYACPTAIEEAVALLASHPGEARPIAGGQSLMPLLAFRLARPILLVDLRKLPDLDRIRIADDGMRLGARVRWRDIENESSCARRTRCWRPQFHMSRTTRSATAARSAAASRMPTRRRRCLVSR
jgi:CO/xanthine dehydrogenase FAD-binding subunit